MSYFGLSKEILTLVSVMLIIFGGLATYIGFKMGEIKVAMVAFAFAFGGIFIAIGANPSKGAPNGTPSMVYCGLALLALGVLFIIGAIIVSKMGIENRTKGISWIIIICIIVLAILGMIIVFESSPSSSPSTNKSPSKVYDNREATCPHCGTHWRNSSFINNGRCNTCRNWKD